MAMLAQQMQLANAMMPGAPLQPVVSAAGFPQGWAEDRQHRETPHSSGMGGESAVLKWPSGCLCVA